MPTEKEIIEALRTVMDPELHRSLVELGMARDIKSAKSGLVLTIALTTPAAP